jgi:hypothetical protein
VQTPLLPTGTPWLRRALVVSVAVHAITGLIGRWALAPADSHETTVVDIEVAPEAPKAEALPLEIDKPREVVAAAQETDEPKPPPEPVGEIPIDAGVDAPPDAPIDARRRPDAAVDAEPDATAAPMVAEADAGVADDAAEADAAAQVAMAGSGDGSAASETGSGSDSRAGGGSGSGDGSAAIAGDGVTPGGIVQPPVDGAPTTAGTAANLLAYFPAGHTVTVLVRFDRLRGSEWALLAERLFKPMPDYHVLFGERDAKIADHFETLVVSTPRPRDATATTLVVRTNMTRPVLRAFLDQPTTPIAWAPARGGLIGRRGGKLMFPGDRRVFLSPYKGWFLLVQPTDIGTLSATAAGELDKVEATDKLPGWLSAIRTIETESGDARGPALVVTLGFKGKPFKLPDGMDIALGVKQVPMPERVSLAMELVKQGWLVRGNLRFASEQEATEFCTSLESVKQRVIDTKVLSEPLRRQHLLNALTGLSVQRAGVRVSYATSISIADARALMAAAAATLDQYYRHTP